MKSSLPQCQSGVATPADVQAEIARMYQAGAKRQEIRDLFKCGNSTITSALAAHDIDQRRSRVIHSPDREAQVVRLYKAGIERASIVAQTGVPNSTISWILKRNGVERVHARRPPVLSETAEAVCKLYLEGLSYSQIAKELGVTTGSVAGIVHRKKIKRDGAINAANSKRARSENGRKAQFNLELGRVVGIKRPKKEGPRQPAAFKIGSSNGHVYKMPPLRDLPKFTGSTPHSNPKPWMQRLSGECTWPVSGEGADTFSCCAPVTPGTCWCEDHNRTGRSNWRTAKGGYHSEPKSFVAELVRRFAA